MNQITKKLSTLGVALAFAAAPALAQDNTSLIEQTGDDHSAQITQTGSTNDATIKQVQGGDGDAITIQTGDLNVASAISGDNVVMRQTQIGNENVATVGQGLLQRASVTQYQEGNENLATLTISGPGTRFASIYQEQVGNENVSEIVALRSDTGFDPDAKTVQMGNENSVVGTWDGSQSNSIDVFQMGDLNVATVDFLSNGNRTVVSQMGGENVAIVEQN